MTNQGEFIRDVDANYTGARVAIGGSIIITSEFVKFKPNFFEKLIRHGNEFTIPVRYIKEVGKEEKASGGVIDTIFGGGLTTRLKLEVEKQNEYGETFIEDELFVLSDDVDDVVDDIKRLID